MINLKICEIVEKLNLKVLSGQQNLQNIVDGIYCCDLLSHVMSNVKQGNAWITVQTNINIVAVTTLTEAACIIIPEEITVEENTIKKADLEGVVILSSNKTAYDIITGFNKLL